MYHWIEDQAFLNRAHSKCADLVNQLVQEAKKHGIDSSMKTVGSMGRNMVTQNANEPIDFDFNLLVRNADSFGSGMELKECVRKAFDVVLKRNVELDCEDSKSALTTKKMCFSEGNRTEFSIDVCIVKKDAYGIHRLIHKKTGVVQFDQWYWNLVPDSKDLHEKETALKESKKWNAVRKAYIDKKNMYLRRGDHNHPSFVCYIEAVNEVFNQINNQGCPPKRRYWNEISAVQVIGNSLVGVGTEEKTLTLKSVDSKTLSHAKGKANKPITNLGGNYVRNDYGEMILNPWRKEK